GDVAAGRGPARPGAGLRAPGRRSTMSPLPAVVQRPGPPTPAAGSAASREARQRAAAILEVLAGARTPAQAAEALGLSLPRYYQLENVALQGLVGACEPVSRGRARSAESELAAL